MSNNIYVGNLPWSYRDDGLKELFAEHGEVTDAKVIVDRMSGRSRGFGFVEMANSEEAAAAIEAGVTIIDASTGGIGGCPFAPKATGNIPTDDLLYMLNRSGVETGVDLNQVVKNSEWLESQLGRAVPAMVPKAGIFPENAEINIQ